MILIADSGSTKTDWCCIHEDDSVDQLTTIGLNPNFTAQEAITKVIEALPYTSDIIHKIYFYGSGCGTAKNIKTIKDAFLNKYPNAVSTVTTDLIGAAKACLCNEEGIIAILGTGSNSGVYDGETIIECNPSLGYILGDYGGGVDIGKQLLRDYFYKVMPEHLREEIDISRDDLIQKLYHEPNANTFIASQTALIFQHAQTLYVRQLLRDVFDKFIKEEILAYTAARSLSINFVGSIAFLFQDVLAEALTDKRLIVGKIIQKPIDSLVSHHLSQK